LRWQDRVEYSADSDVGLRRSNNQDSWVVHLASDAPSWEHWGHLLIVADGMGAHAVGELASKMAVDTIPLNYQKQPDTEPGEALRHAVQEANRTIYTRGHENREFEGMGTTVTVLALLPSGALVAHVGDSRVYRIRAGVIDQLSFDHSLSWELMRQRKVRAEVARQLPSNVIVRSLGPEAEVEVDIEGPFPVKQGDVYLLCSDGLSGQVSNEELGAVAGSLPPKEAARVLVDLANLRGGPDNITVIVAQVGGSEAEAQAAATETRNRGALGRLFGRITSNFSKSSNQTVAAAGNAPYCTAPCQVSEQSVLELASLENQLRQNAVEEAWKIDWSSFFAHHNRAEQSLRDGRCNEALQEYGRAVTFLMVGLRQHRKTRRAGGMG
jgi:serine/threonine protein phosphatase PrpC